MTLHVAFVSLWDAGNPNVESGYGYSMRRQLQQRFEVSDVFPLDLPGEKWWWPVRAFAKLQGRYFHPMREPSVLNALGRLVQRRLEELRPDVIFAPSSLPLSHCDTDVPWVFSTDQLFIDFLGSYIPNPSDRFRAAGETQERRSLDRAAAATFPSEQAARQAVEHYGAAEERISVIPWGGNLPDVPTRDRVERAIEARSATECRLAFIGRDWNRKGGDLLVATVQELNRQGLKTRASIIGCNPSNLPVSGFDVYPYIDKRQPDQFAVLSEILENSHYFFLPSRAEAYGQAFCEAAAFGVPSIGSTVGGIPTIIRPGKTGFLLPSDAPATAATELIRNALADRASYREMALAARQDFEQRLNWDKFGDGLAAVIETAVANPQPRR